MIFKPEKTELISNWDFQLDAFKGNFYNPAIQHYTDVPDCPGNYIICLNKGSELAFDAELIYSLFDGRKVIYTGISGVSLRNRDVKQHFIGNNAGRSTLRLSIGVLLGYERIYRDKNGARNKYKFRLDDEVKLSKWMKENLTMYYICTAHLIEIENFLIEKLNPPLNISKNHNFGNINFRKKLSMLRTSQVIDQVNDTIEFRKKKDETSPDKLSVKNILRTIAFYTCFSGF